MTLKKRYYLLMMILVCVAIAVLFMPRVLCHDRPHGSDDIERFEKLIKYNDFTFESYYCEVKYDIDKKITFFRKYQNFSAWTKYKLYELLMFRGYSDDNNEIFNLAVEFAENGDFKAQIDLADAYKKGWFIEKNITKIKYLTRISECEKQGINIKECELDREFKE